MRKAVIIVGNERRFLAEGRKLKEYLIGEARVERVTLIGSAYLGKEEFDGRIVRHLSSDPGDPLLLAYTGHGDRAGWAFNGIDRFSYDRLSGLLAGRTGSTVVLNDCCHAFAIGSDLERSGIDPSRLRLIASSPAEDVSHSGMTARVIGSWRARRAYQPTEMETHQIPVLFYEPPSWIKLWDASVNWRIRFMNLFRARSEKRHTIIRIRLAPDGAGLSTRIEKIAEERCWGGDLDHLYFPAS